nr:MAG TPA: hypothetical protein [Caudoviricetes sp.]
MEKLTIEEAINREKMMAKRKRWNGKFTKVSQKNEEINKRFKADCIKDAEEHEQLAEWLEELKSYKDIGTPKELKELKENGAFTGLELAKLAIMQKELKKYKDLEEQGLLVRLPCKVGDIVYVDSKILPVKNMECYEDIGNKIPSYFQGRVVSSRFSQRNWVKIAVKAKWLYEWIDDETGSESDYIECEKKFTIPLSMIGKYVFLTREEAEKKLEEMKNND